jgi:hypothetical protein
MKCKYVPTKRDKEILCRYKKGISIGFTGISSLKSKGMIPRSSGKYVIGSKYSCKGMKSERGIGGVGGNKTRKKVRS